MSNLYLLRPATFESSATLMWPEGAQLDEAFPIQLDAEMDFWEGDELIEFADPWFLLTAGARDAIRAAALSGLRTSPLPTLRYSPEGAVRAGLGEFAVRELPEFCIARTVSSISVSNEDGDWLSWSRGDRLIYRGWSGDDFAQAQSGLVVSERARSVLMDRAVPNATFLVLDEG